MLFLHDMDLTLLRSFLAVAETGAITEAAERIGIILELDPDSSTVNIGETSRRCRAACSSSKTTSASHCSHAGARARP